VGSLHGCGPSLTAHTDKTLFKRCHYWKVSFKSGLVTIR
jgi:hypothetical protein